MIALARYRLDFTVESALALPAFAGSTLRGAFGNALRAGTCLTKARSCEACPVLASCPYARIFEPRPPSAGHPLQDFNQIPRPYVIEPPGWGERNYRPGETLSFGLVLAGSAIEQLPLMLWAFHAALQRGVGRGNGTARLAQVWHVAGQSDAVQISNGPGDRIAEHCTAVPPAPPWTGEALTLRFEAPLRLQTNGRRATADEFTARKLLTTLIRRVALMCEFHGTGPLSVDFVALAAQAATLESEKRLQWRDWSRYSSRQQQKMELGGVVGTWTLRGQLAPFLPFLHLGQWLHLGKETVFGLGAYTLEPGA